MTARADAGQAAVEAALTLPLALFMILGTLQLFLMFQARLMTEYAVFRSVRAGSVSQGSCTRMVQAALVEVLPTFAKTTTPGELAAAYRAHRDNRYQPGIDGGRDGDIVWILREPLGVPIPRGQDNELFDDPDREVIRLRARMIFWYPMRIPFANWVIAKIGAAALGYSAYQAQNPLLETQTANWQKDSAPAFVPASVVSSFGGWVDDGQYVFPLQATYAMRMMTAPRARDFANLDCK